MSNETGFDELCHRFALWISRNPPTHGGDYACAECRPDSHLIKPGFVCIYHQALHYIEEKSC